MNRHFFIALVLALCVHHAYCSQDSAKASKAGASSAPAGKSSLQQPAKTTAIEKNSSVEEEDILIDETEEKKSAQNAPEKNAAPARSDTAMNAEKSSSTAVDSLTIVAPGNEQTPVSQPVAVAHDSSVVKEAPQPEKPAIPITVEAVHSINFAKNLKNYRSPKMAMLLSLLVPGLGQAYVKQYVKTGIFVALEATAIGFSIAFNNKGKKQFDQATLFANNNYDYDKMKSYYDGLYGFLLNQEGSSDSAAQAQMDMIYTDTLHSFIKGSQEYYNTIKEQSFVQGWKDCEPSGNVIFNNKSDTIRVGNNFYVVNTTSWYLIYRPNSAGKIDTNQGLYGYSSNQNRYIDMVSKSNNYYKTAQGILFTLIINHILSAIDALISAKAYNDALLGKESFWQHLSIEQQLVKAGPSPSAGLTMRIQF